MALWPEEEMEERAGEIAVACAALLTRQLAWRHRRVETLTVLSHEQVRRSVSVDFTVPVEHHESLHHRGQAVVPLALLAKRPLVNFDLVDEDGRALPLLRSDENRTISRELLYVALDYDLQDADVPEPEAVAVTREAGRLVERVLASGTDAPTPEAVAAEVAALAARAGLPPQALDTFGPLAERLSSAFILFAVLGGADGRRVVKFAYDEPFTQRPGLLHFYDAPGCTEAASYHVEVAIPVDLKARAAVLVDTRGWRPLAGAARNDRPSLYYVADPARVPEEPGVAVWLGTERGRFLAPAATVALVIALLLGLPWLLADLDRLATAAGPAITLLLSTSVAFSALVLRVDEHPLVRLVVTPHRLALLAGALSALAAAATLGFQAAPGVLRATWGVGALVAAGAAGTLALAAIRAPSARTPLRADAPLPEAPQAR